MSKLFFLLLGLGGGYWLAKFMAKSDANSYFSDERAEVKQENLGKIMAMLEQDTELTNDEIQERLNVSDRTVVRYMDQLEKEGKIEQIGQTGRSVSYKKK